MTETTVVTIDKTPYSHKIQNSMHTAKKRFKKIKAVLFDLDGVLIDSYIAWFNQFNETLKHFGHEPICEKKFRKHWGQSTEDDVRIFMPERTLDEVRQYFADHHEEYASHLKINPEAKDILEKLKNMKLKLGCVTNSHRAIVKQILTSLKLIKFFHVIVTADDVKKPKPAPDMLLKACKLLRVTPTQTIFLGDTIIDLKAGKNASCVVIGFMIKSHNEVSSLAEFLDLVQSNFHHT